jgi:phage shock protein A
MANSRDQLVGSSMMDQIKNNIAQYQDQLDQLRARKESVETHETVKSNTYNLTMDKINSLKRTVEKNVFTAIDKKIQIA